MSCLLIGKIEEIDQRYSYQDFHIEYYHSPIDDRLQDSDFKESALPLGGTISVSIKNPTTSYYRLDFNKNPHFKQTFDDGCIKQYVPSSVTPLAISTVSKTDELNKRVFLSGSCVLFSKKFRRINRVFQETDKPVIKNDQVLVCYWRFGCYLFIINDITNEDPEINDIYDYFGV